MKNRYFQPKPPFAILKVTGEDSFSFLQGQFTADLRPLEDNGSDSVIYGLFLENRGKMVADAFVRRSAEGFIVYAPTVEPEILWQRLDDYLIADEVELEDVSSANAILTVFGEADSLSGLSSDSFPSRRWDPAAKDLVLAAGELGAVIERLKEHGFDEASEQEVVAERVSQNLARVPQDTGTRLLPQEAGLEDAICYTKGCFLGQEVMARFKNFGSRRRGLFPVKLLGEDITIETPTPLYRDDKKGGELISLQRTSPKDGFGFAMLPLDWENSPQQISAGESNPVTIEILTPMK